MCVVRKYPIRAEPKLHYVSMNPSRPAARRAARGLVIMMNMMMMTMIMMMRMVIITKVI